MTLDRLALVVRTIDRKRIVALRDVVLIAGDGTVVVGSGRVTPAQLARLDWTDVEFTNTGVVVQLPPKTGATACDVVTLAANGTSTCLVAALRALHDHLRDRFEHAVESTSEISTDADQRWRDTFSVCETSRELLSGPVLPNLNRHGMLVAGRVSRATAMARLARAAGALGVACGRQALPCWSDEQRTQAAAIVSQRRLADVRDRALLLLGFALAARRSNLSMLCVGEVRRQPEGLIVHFRKSKTDQEGQGRDVAVTVKGGAMCPVAAWDAWLTPKPPALSMTPIPACRSAGERTASAAGG